MIIICKGEELIGHIYRDREYEREESEREKRERAMKNKLCGSDLLL